MLYLTPKSFWRLPALVYATLLYYQTKGSFFCKNFNPSSNEMMHLGWNSLLPRTEHESPNEWVCSSSKQGLVHLELSSHTRARKLLTTTGCLQNRIEFSRRAIHYLTNPTVCLPWVY